MQKYLPIPALHVLAKTFDLLVKQFRWILRIDYFVLPRQAKQLDELCKFNSKVTLHKLLLKFSQLNLEEEEDGDYEGCQCDQRVE